MLDFLVGESVTLSVPTVDDLQDLNWDFTINNIRRTKYMPGFGLYPLSFDYRIEEALDYSKPVRSRSILFLLIKHNKTSNFIGSVNLSNISPENSCAVNGLMMTKNAPIDVMLALEAKALICEHGFKTLGINRIEGWQHQDLIRWQKAITTLGFFPEGFLSEKFYKGLSTGNAYCNSCTSKRYKQIIDLRGSYWPGRRLMKDLIHTALATDYHDKIRKSVQSSDEGLLTLLSSAS